MTTMAALIIALVLTLLLLVPAYERHSGRRRRARSEAAVADGTLPAQLTRPPRPRYPL
jgi:hypothetical protein